MVKGLRVVFSPDPASDAVYSYRVPQSGARGTITAVRLGGGVRTYIPGPRAGLVFVQWDGDGLVCAVSLRDLRLEPDEQERGR